MLKRLNKPEDEWKEELLPEQFKVMRKRCTEPPYSGKYLLETREGVYRCSACGNLLFSSSAKYDSGSGWPSFSEPIREDHIEMGIYSPHGTEICCAQCESHLGHVFEDGPPPTGLRYCINSIALRLDTSLKYEKPDKEAYSTP